MKVLITGGSGLVGSRITRLLQDKNIEVVHLTRTPSSKFGIKTYQWDWKKKEIDDNCLNGITDIIHLAGAGIADKPWTMNRKHEIIKSRVETANLIFQKIKETNHQLNSFISASGVGYYGAIDSDMFFTETDQPNDDFIAKSCIYWEKSADQFSELPTRVLKIRTGVVLDKDKGALPKIAKMINLGLGSPIGTGKQAMPWIHLEDIANLYVEVLLDNTYSGVYNAVAPQPVTNEEITKEIAAVLNRPLFLPKVPAFVLRTIYGELSDIVLKGSNVSPKKLLNAGFEFQYPTLKEAIENIYKK